MGKTMLSLGVRKGFPKGSRDPGDVSAVETALRELREETGIDLEAIPRARVSLSNFVILADSGEVFIYFLCAVEEKPPVAVSDDELVGHEWVNPRDLRDVQPVTIPTARLLRVLDDVDLAGSSFVQIHE